MKSRFSVLCGLLLGLVVLDPASAVDLTEVARFNLDSTSDSMNSEFIGSNASSVAWNGSRLFVGGFNGSGGSADVGLLEVENASVSGINNAPTFSRLNTFSATPASGGVIGLDLHDDTLAVAYDNTASGTPGGFSAYDVTTGTMRWSVDQRGSGGPGFDPGFAGNDSGIGYGQFGSGRVWLYDELSGANLADASDGDLWYGGSGGTLVRDLDFDPVSGDIYVRHNNFVSRAERLGADSTIPLGTISGNSPADFVSLQNLSFMTYTEDDLVGNAVIFNDRVSGNSGQSFGDVIKLITPAGAVLTPTFSFLDGASPLSGVGAYDFDYDFGSASLAVLDYANRNVHIFEVGSQPGVECDMNGDASCDALDLRLVYDDIEAGSGPGITDIDGSGTVDNLDIPVWLEEAGVRNGKTYLPGDTDLDGAVSGSDFTNLAVNFGSMGLPGAYWDQGNFDGEVGGSFSVSGPDFTSLAVNFGFQSVATVPEGELPIGLLMIVMFVVPRRFRTARRA